MGVGYLGWGACIFILCNVECWGTGRWFVGICECVRMIFAQIGRELWLCEMLRVMLGLLGLILVFVVRGRI